LAETRLINVESWPLEMNKRWPHSRHREQRCSTWHLAARSLPRGEPLCL